MNQQFTRNLLEKVMGIPTPLIREKHRKTAETSALLTLLLPTIVCFMLGYPVQAQDLPPVSVSGFADLLFTTDHEDSLASDFNLGQVEIDFDAEISPFSAISIAVAYDGEAFTLGAATLDFRLAGTAEDHRYESSWLTNSGIIVGQFDVPFGLDPLVYPSIERNLISSPLAVLGTHDQWNDVGLNLYAEGARFNATAYLTNGFGRDGETEMEAVALAVKRAGGGRLGLVPIEGVEVGFSGATLGGVTATQAMSILGVDMLISQGAWDFKTEYISHRIKYADDLEPTNKGYYLQGMHTHGPWYAVVRYGDFNPGEFGLLAEERLSIGAGVAIFDSAVLRGEYQADLSDSLADQLVFQLVAGF